ncbi:hypothetical protein RxyAA322_29490 [Rubrobacter xylanophilus]|uniref:Uncharacterized protein n=1 Tax=Rubrobacter xylanophilus TaxID=49319 RepID=A0A510HNP2_9ACTN|nr:hypothetical protein RxyAA322_29490 [Rubrobacter xylanophilus]
MSASTIPPATRYTTFVPPRLLRGSLRILLTLPKTSLPYTFPPQGMLARLRRRGAVNRATLQRAGEEERREPEQ